MKKVALNVSKETWFLLQFPTDQVALQGSEMSFVAFFELFIILVGHSVADPDPDPVPVFLGHPDTLSTKRPL